MLYIYKSINGHSPSYLTQMLEMKERPVRLRQFDDQLQLMVPRTRRLGTGAAFSVNGPKLWNALPLNLINVTSLNSFKKNLKTYLFKLYYFS